MNDDSDNPNGAAYIFLAKCALWLAAVTLIGVMVGGIISVVHGSTAMVGNLVQASQVLAFIAITVMGYHGYKGRMLFKNPLQKEESKDSATT